MAIINGMPPVHPGVFLKEILDELHISQNAFAHTIGVSPMRISHVINGARPLTAELALLFGRAFNQTPDYWMNLQTGYDLKVTSKVLSSRIAAMQPVYVDKVAA